VSGNPISKKDPLGLVEDPIENYEPSGPISKDPVVYTCEAKCAADFIIPLEDKLGEKSAGIVLGELAKAIVKSGNKGKSAFDAANCLNECRKKKKSCDL